MFVVERIEETKGLSCVPLPSSAVLTGCFIQKLAAIFDLMTFSHKLTSNILIEIDNVYPLLTVFDLQTNPLETINMAQRMRLY